MTKISFYLLGDKSPESRLVFACRLAEKAHGLGQRMYLHCADSAQAAHLDDLLWTFRQGSFLPHCSAEEYDPADELTPVVIGTESAPEQFDQLLINLADDVSGFFSRFERVAEIVTGDTKDKKQARDRYRFYNDRGYELETHQIK